MPGKATRAASKTAISQLLRGGKAVPASVVRHSIDAMRRKQTAQVDQRGANELQMNAHLARVLGAQTIDKRDPGVTKSLDSLLGTHVRLSKQKLAAPKVSPTLGGLLPGRVTATIVPPFDYDIIIPTKLAGPAPIIDGASDRLTGKMNVSAITSSTKGFGGGSMYTTLGVYFHPIGPGTLTLRASPTLSFQWWTNSLNPSAIVNSLGTGRLTIFGVDVASQTTGEVGTIVSTATTLFHHWDESEAGQINVDFGFDIQAPVSVQMDVNRTLVYLLFVEALAHVHGVGWPGSLAGAKLAVTVPSLTYDFQTQQVFDPG